VRKTGAEIGNRFPPFVLIYYSSCAGLTRASINLRKIFEMDGLPGQARQ
jgi:hypothetical protein